MMTIITFFLLAFLFSSDGLCANAINSDGPINLTLPATPPNKPALLNSTRELQIDVPGTNTRVMLKTLPLGDFVSTADVFMSTTAGLYRVAQGVARRGMGSPLSTREMEIYVGSTALKIDHSDVSLHYMTLAFMADFLYGLSEAVWDSRWYQEATIDIWNGPSEKKIHVGHGLLTRRGSPPNENTATA